MYALLRRYSFLTFRASLGKWLLTVFGMCLSVALFVSVYLINQSSIRSFDELATALEGNSHLHYYDQTGLVDETIVFQLQSRFPSLAITVVSERSLTLSCTAQTDCQARILGTDILAPVGVVSESRLGKGNRKELLKLLQEPYSARGWVPEGCEIPVLNDIRMRVFPIEKPEESEQESLLIMDISWYQDLFQEQGVVEEIIVTLGSENKTDVLQYMQQTYPDLIQRTPAISGENARVMTRAFRLNLLLLSGMGCIVAIFLLITMNWYQIVVRQKELDILYELGVSQARLFRLVVIESFVVALITATLGILLGYQLSLYFLGPVNQTLSILYHTIEIARIHISIFDICMIYISCIIFSWIGLLIPFYELRDTHENVSLWWRLSVVISTICLIVGSVPSLIATHFYAGFIAPIATIVLSLLIVPWLVQYVTVFIVRLSRRLGQVTFTLSAQHVQASKAAGAYAITAIAFALGLSCSLLIMIGGFRHSVSDWLQAILGADIYISTQERDGIIPETLLRNLEEHPSIRAIDRVRVRVDIMQGVPIRVYAASLDVREKEKVIAWYQSPTQEPPCTGNRAFVSEPFYRRFNVGIGDMLTLSDGLSICVHAVIKDYSSEFGAVYLDAATLASTEHFGPVRSISVFLRDTGQAESVLQGINPYSESHSLQVRRQQELRRYVLEVFDKTFAVPYMLQSITLSLSLLVVFVWVSIIAIQRKTELQNLRLLGVSFRRLRHMLALEALIIGSVGLVFALILGCCLAAILVFLVNPHFFGWSLQYHVPVDLLLLTIVVTISGSYCCGMLPARVLLNEAFLTHDKSL